MDGLVCGQQRHEQTVLVKLLHEIAVAKPL